MDYDTICPYPGETWDEVAEASLLSEPTPLTGLTVTGRAEAARRVRLPRVCGPEPVGGSTDTEGARPVLATTI